MPYYFGVDDVIIKHSLYFEDPTHVLGIHQLVIGFICSVLFLVTLYFSFHRNPNNFSSMHELGILRFLKEKHNFLSKLYLIYLIYLIPSIFVWLYPVFRMNRLGRDDNSFNYLALFFILGLVITIILIFRNNIKTMRINLKEELKEELMNEQEKTM